MKENKKIYDKYDERINTGVILLLNCPKFMEFGIDYSAWTIGEKFMGIKLIPEGPHFLYYSTKDENYFFKQGFFINVNQRNKVYVRKWSTEIGDFINLKDEDEENFRVGVNNLDFDAYLGDYPNNQINNWRDLTKFITPNLLERVEPISKKYITSSKEYENDNEESEIKGNIYFTHIPKKNYSLSNKVEPEYLTRTNMDKSTILEELIAKQYNNSYEMLLGEFQYSFITFLLCEIYESFEQWKSIFILICSSNEILNKKENFICDFLEVVYNMFRQFPKDFFKENEIFPSNNFIGKILDDFITNCKNSEVSSKVKLRNKMLEKFLKEYFNYDIKDDEAKIVERYLNDDSSNKRNYNGHNKEEDEDLPVIVYEKEIENIFKYREESKEEQRLNNENEDEMTMTIGSTYSHIQEDMNMD